jgi:translation elongation factor EF-G
MVEAAAEGVEELMNKYLEEGDLTEAEIKLGIRTRTIASEIQPMLCGSLQEQGCAAHAGRRDRTHAVANRHSACQGHG